jgi:hypothetical protein
MSNVLRSYDEWETVAVTALPPGWRNVYRGRDGTPVVSEAPALLLQELRGTVTALERIGPDGRPAVSTTEQPCEAPYETQVVVADLEEGHLVCASDTSNYVLTVGPGEPVPEVLP